MCGCRYVWCWLVCWVVSVVCGVLLCVLRVWRGLARGKNPCVGSKRLRVSVVPAKRAHVETHARVLPAHTEAF